MSTFKGPKMTPIHQPGDDAMNMHALDLTNDTEILRLALLASCRYTPLVEILDIFGVEVMVRFLDTFAGTVVQIPSKAHITKAVRNTGIYVRVARRKETINSVATLYNLDWHTVRTICDTMRKMLEEMEDGVPVPHDSDDPGKVKDPVSAHEVGMERSTSERSAQ